MLTKFWVQSFKKQQSHTIKWTKPSILFLINLLQLISFILFFKKNLSFPSFYCTKKYGTRNLEGKKEKKLWFLSSSLSSTTKRPMHQCTKPRQMSLRRGGREAAWRGHNWYYLCIYVATLLTAERAWIYNGGASFEGTRGRGWAPTGAVTFSPGW